MQIVDTGHIVVGGQKYKMLNPAAVCQSTKFKRPRKSAPDLGVIHWTGSERTGIQGADLFLRAISARRLSVHFFIDNDGTVYQFADPVKSVTYHAGRRANERSVGIEVSCYGWKKNLSKSPNKDRNKYLASINGWHTFVADFLPVQYDALFELCSTLSAALPIQADVPKQIRTQVLSPESSVVPFINVMEDTELEMFSGWVGHAHCCRVIKPNKMDPGFKPLAKLYNYFVQPK